MDRLIAINSVPLSGADTAPASGTPQYATSGNPGAAIPATIFPAYAWNMVQEEIRKVITDAGITPDKTNWGQLSAAISALIASGGQDLSGYETISNANATFATLAALAAEISARNSGDTTLSNALAGFESLFSVGGSPPDYYVHYQPHGVIVQGGKGTLGASGQTQSTVTINFPVPFQSYVGSIHATARGGSNSTHGYPPSMSTAGAASKTQVTFVGDNLSGVFTSPVLFDQTVDFYWEARGV